MIEENNWDFVIIYDRIIYKANRISKSHWNKSLSNQLWAYWYGNKDLCFLWENCMETVTLKKVLIEGIYYI